MNPIRIKPLLQVKDEDGTDKLSVTLLVDEETIAQLLEQMRSGEDKRASISLQAVDSEFTLEVYRPGAAKNLQYAANIKRPGWSILSVATI